MQLIESISDMRRLVDRIKASGRRVGFVPTMGYLHEGHLSLVKEARQRADWVVMSIFVNPIQFGAGEDFARYPRDLNRDSELASWAGVDVLFVPKVEEMYPSGFTSFVEVVGITDRLCGAYRPGHFRGVTTVVAKLLNIIRPDVACFGQKDAQQLIVIKRMVEDLNMGIEIVGVPTMREPDGLAMSSRNKYLSADERRAATILYRALKEACALIKSGERSGDAVRRIMRQTIEQEPLARIQYVSACDRGTLEELDPLQGPVLLALAVFLGETRLIDNTMFDL